MAGSGRVLLAAAVLCAACCQVANASTGTDRHRTLVLVGEEGIRQTHSKYLAAVEALGSELDIRLSSDPKLQLRHWDDLLYETVIVLHPEAKGRAAQESTPITVCNDGHDAGIHTSCAVFELASSLLFVSKKSHACCAELGGAVDSGALVEFVDAGGNLLLALDTGVSDQVRPDIQTSRRHHHMVHRRHGRQARSMYSSCLPQWNCVPHQVRELASELGVDVEPAGMAVIDHFSHDPADPSHATVVAANFVDSKAVFGGRSPVRRCTRRCCRVGVIAWWLHP